METPTLDQIETLRDLFLKKIEKDGEVNLHPLDIERVKSSNRWMQLFLEQQDLDMKQALTMLWDTCTWRKTYGTNEITEKTIRMDYINSGIVYPRNKDIDGKVLLIFKSKLHTKGSRDVGELIRCLVYWIERIQRQTNYDQLTLFFDMQSAGLGNMDMDLIKRIIDTFKMYYPNSLNYIAILDMPWVLNAAFKIIKGLLPPKAVARMKFVNTKTIKEIISEENLLKNWGGNDDYEFKFEPENYQQKPTTEALQSKPKDSTSPVQGSARKVHFASASAAESLGNDPGAVSDGELLHIKPDDSIVFIKNGNDLMGSVQVTNASKKHVAYKIKTTSPDKFRVKPSSGILTPAGKSTITVILQQGHDLSTINKDKFLVMCMAIPDDVAPTEQSVSELWKSTPTSSPDVEQHRLRCTSPQLSPGDGYKNGRLNAGTVGGVFNDSDKQITQLYSQLNQLTETTQRLEKQATVTQRLQWLTILMFFVLMGTFFFLFSSDGANRNEL